MSDCDENPSFSWFCMAAAVCAWAHAAGEDPSDVWRLVKCAMSSKLPTVNRSTRIHTLVSFTNVRFSTNMGMLITYNVWGMFDMNGELKVSVIYIHLYWSVLNCFMCVLYSKSIDNCTFLIKKRAYQSCLNKYSALNQGLNVLCCQGNDWLNYMTTLVHFQALALS